MSENCHKVLKMYAALKGKTISDVSYAMMRAHIHKEAKVNDQVRMILRFHDIEVEEIVE